MPVRQRLSRRRPARSCAASSNVRPVDDGAWADLLALHRELDEVVADCYGWRRSVAQNDRELVRRLTDLNREITEGGRPYVPFEDR